jgi:hypothetical protein
MTENDTAGGTTTIDSNDTTGSLSGVLTPGVDYVAYFYFELAYNDDGLPAAGTGNVNFSFTDTSAPEPATATLLALAIPALLARRRRR